MKIIYSTSLLSWTMSRDLLINLTTLLTFWLFHENLTSPVSIFSIQCPTRSNWQMILSQTKIFNIFPGSLKTSSAIKILSSYCNRYIYKCIPHRDLWLHRRYFEISNSPEKKCQTIDMRHVNNLGLPKFRIGAKNGKE